MKCRVSIVSSQYELGCTVLHRCINHLMIVLCSTVSWRHPTVYIKLHDTIRCNTILHIAPQRFAFRFLTSHDDVMKWKHFPRHWPFVQGIHRSPVNSPHKSQWRGALICIWINDWVNNRAAVDLRRYRAHYDVIVMTQLSHSMWCLL